MIGTPQATSTLRARMLLAAFNRGDLAAFRRAADQLQTESARDAEQERIEALQGIARTIINTVPEGDAMHPDLRASLCLLRHLAGCEIKSRQSSSSVTPSVPKNRTRLAVSN